MTSASPAPLHITLPNAYQALELLAYLRTTYTNLHIQTPHPTLQHLLDVCPWQHTTAEAGNQTGQHNPTAIWALDTAYAEPLPNPPCPPDALLCWFTIENATPARGREFLLWQAAQSENMLAGMAKRGQELHTMLQRKKQELNEKFTKTVQHAFPPEAETYLPATNIDKLYACPFRFYTERKLGRQPETDDAPTSAARGNLTHRWLEAIFTKKVAPEAALTHMHQTLDAVLADVAPLAAALWRPRLEVLLPDIQEAYLTYLNTPQAQAYAEEKMSATYAGLHLSARIDLYITAGTSARVIDHKTGSPPNKSDIKTQKNKQLPLAWWLATQQNGQQNSQQKPHTMPHTIEVWDMPFKRQGQFSQNILSANDLPPTFAEDMAQGLTTLAATLPQHGYPAIPGAHCQYCKMAGVCRKAEWEAHHDS